METMDAIRNRKSVRSYTGEPVTKDELDQVLAAAQASPAAMGSYDKLHLTVITNPEILAEIDAAGAAMFNNPDIPHPLYGAPQLVLVSAQIAPGRENAMHSTAAMIVHNMSLAATELGVGSCDIWGCIAAANTKPALIAKLKLPEGFTACCAMTLGKTNETFPARTFPADRIAISEIA